MSAQLTYDIAPLGSLVRYSDGTPKPPQRSKRKLAAWENSNSSGRLIRKVPGRQMATCSLPASITLHKGDYASGGVIVMVGSDLLRHHRAEVRTRRKSCPGLGAGSQSHRDDAGLLHLAANHAGAEDWLAVHRHLGAILQEVTADEIVADVVEGRAVA